jgi:regulator of cell morphogenesis and NO signaling
MNLQADKTVREIAIEHPASVRVFDSLGIDYCCGGTRPLAEACRRANISTDQVLAMLARLEARPEGPDANWSQATLAELIEHIVERHHAYIARESARLIPLLDKVAARHGPTHSELKSIQDLFKTLVDELFAHMMKEERVLFPYLVRLERAAREGVPAPRACCDQIRFGSVEMPISRMLADHEDAGALARRIRALACDFRPPADACGSWHALYHGLEEFERDLHHHVHLENNILFPRALELERNGESYARS